MLTEKQRVKIFMMYYTEMKRNDEQKYILTPPSVVYGCSIIVVGNPLFFFSYSNDNSYADFRDFHSAEYGMRFHVRHYSKEIVSMVTIAYT